MMFLSIFRSVDLPAPSVSAWEQLCQLAGMLLVVQGFETSRYLGSEFSAELRNQEHAFRPDRLGSDLRRIYCHVHAAPSGSEGSERGRNGDDRVSRVTSRRSCRPCSFWPPP